MGYAVSVALAIGGIVWISTKGKTVTVTVVDGCEAQVKETTRTDLVLACPLEK